MSLRSGRRRPTVVASLLLVFCVGAAVPARAATVVVLVRPAQPSPLAVEATVRLHGELVGAGFEVQEIDSPSGGDIRTALEQAAGRPGVEAVVAILGDTRGEPLQESAELWVIDRVTGKTVVRRVPNAPGSARAAEILSIRALELLRASFLEVALAAGRAPKSVAQPPPAEVTRFAEDALEEAMDNRPRVGWAVEVGGCVLGSVEGVKPSLVPIARIQRGFGDHFLGRVTLAGLGTQSHLNTEAGGTADVSQEFGLVEGALRFRVDQMFQPFLSLGTGALHVAAVGHVSGQYQGISNSLWALLVDAGAGVHIPIGGRFELSLEVHAQAAHPYPEIRFFEDSVAREGRLTRPTLISSLSVIAWL